MLKRSHRDDVFVAGGQPTVTYVERAEDHVERNFARAIASPNEIVSLSGPTKTGKTVLCRRILGKREHVWIDGGQVRDGPSFWERVSSELNLPLETENTTGRETTVSAQGELPFIATAGGSRLYASGNTQRQKVHSMGGALREMLANKIILVIDDFHYLDEETRVELMRNLKGAVFNGLKVILLSVTHRVFDAIKAESELTGRFTAIGLPHWSADDLRKIPDKGFDALSVDCPDSILERICAEAQESPFLVQRFCWELCFDLGIEEAPILGRHKVPPGFDLNAIFKRISESAGLPIYQKLATGPQSRKIREKRPLASGGEADIYQAILLALATTGPKPVVSYEELRTSLSAILSARMPQKHEITSALKHLARISRKEGTTGGASAMDWDEDKREVALVDPYLRFFLRWQIKPSND